MKRFSAEEGTSEVILAYLLILAIEHVAAVIAIVRGTSSAIILRQDQRRDHRQQRMIYLEYWEQSLQFSIIIAIAY